jgi:cytochrome c oxidase assembly factor CtaG
MAKRIVDGVLALMLVLFAVLQTDDPPPGNIPWVMIYAAGAVVCGASALGRRMRGPALIVAGIAAAYAVYLIVDVLLAGGSPFTLFIWRMDDGGEEQREAAGLLIMVAAVLWVGLRRDRKPESK